MSELKPCPFCGGRTTAKTRYIGYGSLGLGSHDEYRVVCQECRASSDEYRYEAEAIAAWNRRAEPSEKPLTLDELRQMDREPVYIAEEKLWVIIKCEQTGRWAGMPFAVGQTHGINFEWNIKKRGLKCYRSKPKEEV